MTRRGRVLAVVALAAGFLFGQQVVAALPWQLTVATVCALVAAVMLGHYLRAGASIDFDGMELPDADRLVNYRCAVKGHAFGPTFIEHAARGWTCKVCGEVVVSPGGWVA